MLPNPAVKRDCAKARSSLLLRLGDKRNQNNMNSSSPNRFNAIAGGYATSEVHSGSPTLDRLHALLPRVDSVCDLASGAGHTGLGFAGIASRIVAVDPAPNMLVQVRRLALERGVSVEMQYWGSGLAKSHLLRDTGSQVLQNHISYWKNNHIR
jgi:hypothetical protein